VTAAFTVIFAIRYGDLPEFTADIDHLTCNPLGLPYVPAPPYDYPLPKCPPDIVFCSPELFPCRPVPEDDLGDDGPCCEPLTIRDSANVYSEVMLQRDLFDPNFRKTPGSKRLGDRLTVKDLAVLKGLNPSKYNAYKRDFVSGTMTPINFTDPVETKMSVVLIETAIDSTSARQRIAKRIKFFIATGREYRGILPARMVWEGVPTGSNNGPSS
jgi:hypothetical protein